MSMSDSDIQRKLLRETVMPDCALKIAINIKMGQQNQIQINKASQISKNAAQKAVPREKNSVHPDSTGEARTFYAGVVENACRGNTNEPA